METSLDEGFTAEDKEQRPFAVEAGYNEWANEACRLVVQTEVSLGLLGEDLQARNSVNDELPRGLVLAMDSLCTTCELGYQSRDIKEIDMATPSRLAKTALGDGYINFLRDDVFRLGSQEIHQEEVEETLGPRFKLASLIPLVAESAYLWGRHGSQIDPPESLPEIILDSDLVTVRPHATEKTQDPQGETTNIYETLKNFEPYQPSILERLGAKLSRKKWEEVRVKEGVAREELFMLIDSGVQLVLEDTSTDKAVKA